MQLGMSQESLAEKTGLSCTHISNLENGKTKLSLDTFVAICDVLEISVNSLLFSTADCPQLKKSSIDSVLSTCSDNELVVISDVVEAILKNTRNN